jgi:hypothetical protein
MDDPRGSLFTECEPHQNNRVVKYNLPSDIGVMGDGIFAGDTRGKLLCFDNAVKLELIDQ